MTYSIPNRDAEQPEPRKRKKKKLPKVISASEAERLLSAARADPLRDPGEGIRNALMIEFMYRAGLRVSEVCNLQIRDVERDGVIRLYDAKGGDGTAYFDPATVLPRLVEWEAVRVRWLAHRTDTLQRLFIKPNGDPVIPRYLQRLVKRLKGEVGIHGICTPHVFRHTFATELIGEGFNLPEVQVALRHANLQTTAVYLHVRDESLRAKVARRGKESHEEPV